MKTTLVNKQQWRLDQFTGRPIPEGDPVFKVPVFNQNKSSFEWKHCFAAPSICLAYIQHYAEKNKLPNELKNEMVDLFQKSLKFVPLKNSSHTMKNYHIQVAPQFTELKKFKGTLSYKDYTKKWDPDGIQKNLFTQKIPAGENDSEMTAPLKKWMITDLSYDEKCSEESVKAILKSAEVTEVPRGITQVFDYINVLWGISQGEVLDEGKIPSHPVVIYYNPTTKAIGIGDPNEWDLSSTSRSSAIGSKLFCKNQVRGNILVLHKKPLKLGKRHKSKTKSGQKKTKKAVKEVKEKEKPSSSESSESDHEPETKKRKKSHTVKTIDIDSTNFREENFDLSSDEEEKEKKKKKKEVPEPEPVVIPVKEKNPEEVKVVVVEEKK